MPKSFRHVFLAAGLFLSSGFFLAAKDIPRDKYIRYLPLHQPQIIAQTQASKKFSLYGDSGSPSFRDANPADGIDDNRYQVLLILAQRFSPYLVQNTAAVPMDFEVYFNETSLVPLYVDTWDIAQENPTLLKSEKLNLNTKNSQIFEIYKSSYSHLHQNPNRQILSTGAEQQSFRVLYFDFPGNDEKSWKEEYRKFLAERNQEGLPSPIRTYVHPFILERNDPHDSVTGYEFIFQYWFFYPFNDGGNNHEGDWEHINVVISPLDRADSLLSEKDVQSILQTEGISASTASPQMVIKRVEYYFHFRVMVLDFSRPNVYLPEKLWREEIENLETHRVGQRWIWERIRELAYVDEAEQLINTHPIGYIGGDNRGYDQILAFPGPKNRDPHGNYPLPGIYRAIGPAEASEKIAGNFAYKNISNSVDSNQQNSPESLGRGNVVRFDSPSRIKIIPDWEKLIKVMEINPDVRREWMWLVLPIRWGYPASASPLAGVIPHTETGNLSPVGPAYNMGWNRIHTGPGYTLYEPHRLSPWLPLDWQGNFQNRWGTLNGLFPTLLNMPPLDLCAQIVSSIFHTFGRGQGAVFTPMERLPFRHIGISTGIFSQTLPEDFFLSSFSGDQLNEIEDTISKNSPAFQQAGVAEKKRAEPAVGGLFRISLHLGKHLTSENTLRFSQSQVGEDIFISGQQNPLQLRAELLLWQYSGNFRFNLAARSFLPFVKAGYGWSWHRLDNIRLDETPLNFSSTAWFQKPSFFRFQNLWPNTWQWGAGIEILPFKRRGGVDLGIQLEFIRFSQSQIFVFNGLFGSGEPEERRIWSQGNEFCLSLSLSY